MAGTGTTGITGDSGDETISLETGNTLAKYIKIDVPDFNNALAGDLSSSDAATYGAGSGQGSMRSYLRLGAIEQALNKATGQWGPSSKVGKGATPATPNAADLASLIAVVGTNPLLWSTVATGGSDFMSSLNTAESAPLQPTGASAAAFGSNTGPAGATTQATVGLVIPGQISATMIQSGVTGTTGDPFLQELIATPYDSTGEDLASLVKGFIDDSRMRSDGGSTAWWGGAVRIDTPFNANYSAQVGSSGLSGAFFPQGIPATVKLDIDSELSGIAPAAFMMPTWTTAASPPGHAESSAWGNFGNASGATGVDWSLGGFPAPTDAGPPGFTGPAPFVPGWMVPIRLGGPQQSTWGAQATLNTSTVEGPLYGWDPHPSANVNTPDWAGGIITTPMAVAMPSTLPAFAVDGDGNKLGAGVPIDPRDPSGMTPLPGYGTLIASKDILGSQAAPWDTGNINAVSTWLATDYRTIESTQLHTKGGWRDHTDGNRITTTRGDKVEVIRGNYKLIVIGRQDGTKGAGFDMGGGGNDTFTTASASTDPSTLSTITEYKLCDDGQYRSWSTTKKGSGTPKIGGDGITVTLPTGSVQVSETWGWKSYNYTGVEKMKILSGGSGPPTGGTIAAPNHWFGPVQYSSGDPKKPQSYIPVATPYAKYDPTAAGFAGGPALPIVGENIFVKPGMNDDTRGMIWPVAETITESHTTKTYSATFVRDTVSITAGPMLTVPFSLGASGAGMILPWPTGKFPAAPLQVPPTAGAYPQIVQANTAPGVAETTTYNYPAPALVLDAFGAYPLAAGSFLKDGAGNTGPTVDGGLPSDYLLSSTPGSAGDGTQNTRLALEGTGIPIPGQPYQKVNSTTAETHVKTQIARTFADYTFAQSFTGKSYTQSGTPTQWNGLTNALTWVNTARSESHTKDSKSYTFVDTQHNESTVTTKTEAYNYTADQYTESHVGRQKTVSHIGFGAGSPSDPHASGAGAAIGAGIGGAIGALAGGAGALAGAAIGAAIGALGGPVQETETFIVGNVTSLSNLAGTQTSLGMVEGLQTGINLLLGGSCTIKVNASLDLSVALSLTNISINVSLLNSLFTLGPKALINFPAKVETGLSKAQLQATDAHLTGTKDQIAAAHTVLAALIAAM